MVVASPSLQPAKQSVRSTIMSSPVMSSIPSPQPCSPCHSRHWWQPRSLEVATESESDCRPARQHFGMHGIRPDSRPLAITPQGSPASDRSEGRSEEALCRRVGCGKRPLSHVLQQYVHNLYITSGNAVDIDNVLCVRGVKRRKPQFVCLCHGVP